ncbi:MAG: hypothetical protein RIC14_12435 [Filomicrobium sp.]
MPSEYFEKYVKNIQRVRLGQSQMLSDLAAQMKRSSNECALPNALTTAKASPHQVFQKEADPQLDFFGTLRQRKRR